jgi:hypothetical protein
MVYVVIYGRLPSCRLQHYSHKYLSFCGLSLHFDMDVVGVLIL